MNGQLDVSYKAEREFADFGFGLKLTKSNFIMEGSIGNKIDIPSNTPENQAGTISNKVTFEMSNEDVDIKLTGKAKANVGENFAVSGFKEDILSSNRPLTVKDQSKTGNINPVNESTGLGLIGLGNNPSFLTNTIQPSANPAIKFVSKKILKFEMKPIKKIDIPKQVE